VKLGLVAVPLPTVDIERYNADNKKIDATRAVYRDLGIDVKAGPAKKHAHH
jgi:hypothetical protein